MVSWTAPWTVVLGALDPVGDEARTIDDLWWFMLVLAAAVLVIVMAILVIGLVRRGGDPDVRSSTTSELAGSRAARWSVLGGGIALPAVVVTGVLVATVWTMRAVGTDEPAAFEIEVVGHQWWWEVTYPDHGVVTANELHIPAEQPVDVVLRSADVIHSFWVPSLAGKLDLLPDRPNRLRLEASRPGEFAGVCAEFCGLQHANMRFVVVAHEPGDFEDWVARHAGPAPPPQTELEATGQQVLVERCGSCHTVAGTAAQGRQGPDLTHVMSRQTLAAGAIETTPEQLRRWISDPHAIKEGVLMPQLELSSDQLDAVVEYLRTLR